MSKGNKAPNSSKDTPAPPKLEGILEREERYRQINAQLEAKTAALVSEADKLLNRSEFDRNRHSTNLLTAAFEEDIENDLDQLAEDSTAKKKAFTKPGNKKPAGLAGPPGRAAALVATIEEGDLPQNSSFLTDFREDLHKRVAQVAAVHENMEDNGDASTVVDDLLPPAADQLSHEAQMRFLKAKLRVLQEENDKLCTDIKQTHEEMTRATQRLKEVEEERNHLHRISTGHQTKAEKHKKLADELKEKNATLEAQLQSTTKELQALKREIDQQGVSQKGQSARLNRALEEVEKGKSQLQEARRQHKEQLEKEQKRVETLQNDCKRLEKQKAELIAGYKRQMRLIDVLKRQRMHIEAAKMLQFTEEEFMRALDWAQ